MNTVSTTSATPISFSEITIVFQGPVDRVHTPRAIASARRVFPGSPIILSTWKESFTHLLDVDMLVQSEDPGGHLVDPVHEVSSNVNRQIVSSCAGLKAVETRYALKVRSDIEFVSDRLISEFLKYSDQRSDIMRVFTERVVVSNFYFANPREIPFCFHMSDWVQFGLTKDLLRIWEIPLEDDSDFTYFSLSGPRPEPDIHPTWTHRYVPEQYIFLSFLRKAGFNPRLEHFSDTQDLELSELATVNNFIIIDYEDSGFRFRKFNPYINDVSSQLNFRLWRYLNGKYLGSDPNIPKVYFLKAAFRTAKSRKLQEDLLRNASEFWFSLVWIIRFISRPLTVVKLSAQILSNVVFDLLGNRRHGGHEV